MSVNKIAASILIFFSSLQLFSFEIIDPRSDLKNILNWPNRSSFNEAFKCDKTHNYFFSAEQCSLSCDDYVCETKCKTMTRLEAIFYVEDCGSGETINLYSDRGHSIEVIENSYNLHSKTMIVETIRLISEFLDPIYKIKVERVYPIKAKLIEDGRMKTLNAIQIVLNVYPNSTNDQYINVYINFNAEASGLNQILCISDEVNCDNYFFKRKGFIYER